MRLFTSLPCFARNIVLSKKKQINKANMYDSVQLGFPFIEGQCRGNNFCHPLRFTLGTLGYFLRSPKVVEIPSDFPSIQCSSWIFPFDFPRILERKWWTTLPLTFSFNREKSTLHPDVRITHTRLPRIRVRLHPFVRILYYNRLCSSTRIISRVVHFFTSRKTNEKNHTYYVSSYLPF